MARSLHMGCGMGLAIATCVPFVTLGFKWHSVCRLATCVPSMGGMCFAGLQQVCPGLWHRFCNAYVRSFVCVSFYLFFLVGYLH